MEREPHEDGREDTSSAGAGGHDLGRGSVGGKETKGMKGLRRG